MEARAVTLELLGTNEQEVAYLAGIFDGEGSMSIHDNQSRFMDSKSLVVAIAMTTPQPLYLCQRIFGGSICLRKTYGHYKPQYSWRVGYRKAEVFLRVIEPYLTVKKEKANLALTFLTYGKGHHPGKLALAYLISPLHAKNHGVNPDEPNTPRP